MGRPIKHREGCSIVTVSMPSELVKELNKEIESKGVDRSAIFVGAITAHLNQEGKPVLPEGVNFERASSSFHCSKCGDYMSEYGEAKEHKCLFFNRGF